jgi:hypothetical protein
VVEEARQLRPSIPRIRHDGIQLRDEFDLIRPINGEDE